MGLFLIVGAGFTLCVPAWCFARQKRSWFAWDYATVFGPFLIWLMLAIGRVGSSSMSNLVELLVLAALVPAAISIRVFVLDRIWIDSIRSSLSVCFICCVVFPLALRLGMPELPE